MWKSDFLLSCVKGKCSCCEAFFAIKKRGETEKKKHFLALMKAERLCHTDFPNLKPTFSIQRNVDVMFIWHYHHDED